MFASPKRFIINDNILWLRICIRTHSETHSPGGAHQQLVCTGKCTMRARAHTHTQTHKQAQLSHMLRERKVGVAVRYTGRVEPRKTRKVTTNVP